MTVNIRLGLCSSYSLLYGVRRPGELIENVKALGTDVVCIADRDNLYGLPAYLEKAKEAGLRPVIGVCLTIDNYGAAYCFVQNREGYSRLCELLTIKNRDKKNYNPLALLRENSSGLILASADAPVLEALAGRVKRLYGAVTPDTIGAAGITRRLHIPLAFLDTSLFLEKEDYNIHRVLRAIGLNKTIGSLKPEDTVAEGSRVLQDGAALHKRLCSWPESLTGTAEIAAGCTYNDLFDGFIFPEYASGNISPAEELYNRVIEGAAARYGELGDSEINRIEYELNIISQKGFAPYFLVMDDIVRMSPRTCGRGSGAASIVSYSLGITNVDPVRHQLYFERFLNPARIDPPDVDVDFAWDGATRGRMTG